MPDAHDLIFPKGAVFGFDSAARNWGFPEPPNLLPQAHVIVPRSRSRWRSTSAVVHRRDLLPSDVVQVDELLVTSPLRTILDLAATWPIADAVAAGDFALHQGLVGEDELSSRTQRLRGPGATQARRLISLVDRAAESPMESLVRVVMALGLVPAPISQLEIWNGGHLVARVDFGWPAQRVYLEADGFAYHSDRAAYRRDRQRLNALGRLGWRPIWITWEQVVSDPDSVVQLVLAYLNDPTFAAA